MRLYVLILGGIEAIIWLAVTLWAARQPVRVDISALHSFFFVCTLPGLALGLLNRAPRAAAGLTTADATVAVVSQIAS